MEFTIFNFTVRLEKLWPNAIDRKSFAARRDLSPIQVVHLERVWNPALERQAGKTR